MLVDHNPTLPNRHAAIAGHGASVGPLLAKMATGLQAAGADFIVMPCNTAHAFADEVRAAITVPFLDIIEISASTAAEARVGKAGVMAAEGCLAAGLYQRALAQRDIEPVLWTAAELQQFMEVVYRIKAGERGVALAGLVDGLAQALVDRGAELLIAACTEIPLIFQQDHCPVPLLASTELLARNTVLFARG
jgi:aspartate racemase